MAKRVGGSTATATRPSGWHFGQLGAVLMLDAVAPYIDSWVIVDTGSDDGTQDLIRNHMAGRGIHGELHQGPGVALGDNLAEALTLAQGHGDYIWVIDAGDTVVGTPDFDRLGADIYWLRHQDADDDIPWRAQLFRDGVHLRYEGVTQAYAAWHHSFVDARPHGDYQIEGRFGCPTRKLRANPWANVATRKPPYLDGGNHRRERKPRAPR